MRLVEEFAAGLSCEGAYKHYIFDSYLSPPDARQSHKRL